MTLEILTRLRMWMQGLFRDVRRVGRFQMIDQKCSGSKESQWEDGRK